MPALSKPKIHSLVHEALVARVRVLLGQCTYAELMATQTSVSLTLALRVPVPLPHNHEEAHQVLADAVVQAFALDPNYYDGSAIDFLVSEGLSSAGMSIAAVIAGHERGSRKRWLAEVVPQLDRIERFVVSVFDGSWSRSADRCSLAVWLQR